MKQSRLFSIVLEYLDKDTNQEFTSSEVYQNLEFMRKDFGLDYWFILHDRDISEDNNGLKRKHYHIVLLYPTRHTATAILKHLALYFVCSEKAISIECGKNLRGCVRYLTHIDFKGFKNLYSIEEIFTSDKNSLVVFYEPPKEVLTFDYLRSVIQQCNSITEVISMIGLANYKAHNWAIKDMWKDKKF